MTISIKESGVTNKISGKVKAGAKSFWHDNRGTVDLDAPIGGGKKSLFSKIKNKFNSNKNIAVNRISYNPKDDIFVSGIKPESVSYHRTYYAKYGRFDCTKEPIVVYDVGNGNYMMQGGHHRLKAAKDMNLETIRVNEIIPYSKSVKLGITELPLGEEPRAY